MLNRVFSGNNYIVSPIYYKHIIFYEYGWAIKVVTDE